MKKEEHNKVHFKLGRFLEFEASGKDAIHSGKPYMVFVVAFFALLLAVLNSARSSGFEYLFSLLAR
jgi:hypothetical protein